MPQRDENPQWEVKEWSEEDLVTLSNYWINGDPDTGRQLSVREIGEKMHRSRNGIVGKVHRLKLPGRGSPILKRPEGWVPVSTAPRAGPRTLPPLKSLEVGGVAAEPVLEKPTPEPKKPDIGFRVKQAFVAPKVAAPKPVIVALEPPEIPLPFVYKRVIECLFPMGEPGHPGYHECGNKSVPGKSYCEEHYKMAFIKIRDRREEEVNYSIRRYG